MVTQIDQVEAFVNDAIQRAAEAQGIATGNTVATAISAAVVILRKEIDEAFTARLEENMEASVQKAMEALREKHTDMESRLEQAHQGMNSALVKMGGRAQMAGAASVPPDGGAGRAIGRRQCAGGECSWGRGDPQASPFP